MIAFFTFIVSLPSPVATVEFTILLPTVRVLFPSPKFISECSLIQLPTFTVSSPLPAVTVDLSISLATFSMLVPSPNSTLEWLFIRPPQPSTTVITSSPSPVVMWAPLTIRFAVISKLRLRSKSISFWRLLALILCGCEIPIWSVCQIASPSILVVAKSKTTLSLVTWLLFPALSTKYASAST